MKKKILCTMMSMVMAASLFAGCGTGTGTETSASDNSKTEETGTEAAEEEDFLHDIAEEIGLVKNNGLKIGQFVSKKCRQDTFRELYEKYEAQRKAVRKLDFDDMLVLCKDLFVSHPDVLKLSLIHISEPTRRS